MVVVIVIVVLASVAFGFCYWVALNLFSGWISLAVLFQFVFPV